MHGAVSSDEFLLWLCMNLEMGSVPSWFEKTGLQCSVKPLTVKDVLHFPEATEYFCLKSHDARIFHLVRHFVTENLLVTDYLLRDQSLDFIVFILDTLENQNI